MALIPKNGAEETGGMEGAALLMVTVVAEAPLPLLAPPPGPLP